MRDEFWLEDQSPDLFDIEDDQTPDSFGAFSNVLRGPEGPAGKSAYQVAVDNGFVGTEEEWLESLVGPPGADGTVSFDELTPAQKESLRGEGVPAGGTTGQVLAKSSNADYETEWVDQSGGGGGTSDYTDLTNKPSINNVTLSGNKTAAQLGLAAASDIPTVPVQSVNSKTGAVVLSASDVSALPTAGGTMEGDIDMGRNKITNVPTPTYYLDAANKNYVDARYIKPSTGIPQSDLASAVQTSLDKADSALQAVPSTYRTAAAQDEIDAAQDAEIGIVITGARPAIAVTAGQYVIVRNSTISGITDGLYTANAALSPSTDVTAANLTAVSGGGLNDVGKIVNYNPALIASGVGLNGASLMTVVGHFFFFRAVVNVATAQTQYTDLFQMPDYNYDSTTTNNVLVNRVDGTNGYTTVSIVGGKIRVMLSSGMATGRYEILLFGKCT